MKEFRETIGAPIRRRCVVSDINALMTCHLVMRLIETVSSMTRTSTAIVGLIKKLKLPGYQD